MGPKFISIPSVEITKDGDTKGTRCPLQESYIAIRLLLETEFIVGSWYLVDATFRSLENIKPFSIFVLSKEQIVHEWFQIRIIMGYLRFAVRIVEDSQWLYFYLFGCLLLNLYWWDLHHWLLRNKSSFRLFVFTRVILRRTRILLWWFDHCLVSRRLPRMVGLLVILGGLF